MRARIKTYLSGISPDLTAEYGPDPKIIYGPPGAGMWFEAEIIDPPSRKGQSCDVFIPPEVVDNLLRALRDTAIKARQKTMVDT